MKKVQSILTGVCATILLFRSADARKLEFTWEGNVDDAAYRGIVDAIFADLAAREGVRDVTCRYGDDIYQQKAYNKARKKNKLAESTTLLSGSCEFKTDKVCEISSFSKEEKCYSGETVLLIDNVDLSDDGGAAQVNSLQTFFEYPIVRRGGKTELSKRIVNIFKYQFAVVHDDDGWRVNGRRFDGMFDL